MSKKTWLVTGCSGGFGLALTRALLAHGEVIIASSRDPAKTPELVSEVTEASGHWITLDITSQTLEKDLRSAWEVFGPIDVLVNNAGFSVLGAFEDFSLEDARGQMETNFFGPLRAIQALLPLMRERRSGTIVNMSSTAGRRSLPAYSMYSASKFAIEGLSEGLAAEVAEFGLRVIVVEPGGFDTNFLSSTSAAYHPLSPVYEGTAVDARMKYLLENARNLPGDPRKAAERIYEAVMGIGVARDQHKHLRLPLGSDCLRVLEDNLRSVTENLNDMRDVAYSTDKHGDV